MSWTLWQELRIGFVSVKRVTEWVKEIEERESCELYFIWCLWFSGRLVKRTKCSKKWINVAQFIIGTILNSIGCTLVCAGFLNRTNSNALTAKYENRIKTMLLKHLLLLPIFTVFGVVPCLCVYVELSLWQKSPMQSGQPRTYDRLVLNGKVCVTYVAQTTRVESLQTFIRAFLLYKRDVLCHWYSFVVVEFLTFETSEQFEYWVRCMSNTVTDMYKYMTIVLNVCCQWIMCASSQTEKFQQF